MALRKNIVGNGKSASAQQFLHTFNYNHCTVLSQLPANASILNRSKILLLGTELTTV